MDDAHICNSGVLRDLTQCSEVKYIMEGPILEKRLVDQQDKRPCQPTYISCMK